MAAYTIEECIERLDRMDKRVVEIVATRPEFWQTSFWPMYPHVRNVYAAHHRARCAYYGVATLQWMNEQDDMEPPRRKYRLETVWQCWRDVLSARDELESLGGPVHAHGGNGHGIFEVGNVPTLERIDAMIAVDRLEGLYDLVLRAFEGRAPRTWEQTLNIKVKPPTRPMPSRNNRKTSRRRSLAAMME